MKNVSSGPDVKANPDIQNHNFLTKLSWDLEANMDKGAGTWSGC